MSKGLIVVIILALIALVAFGQYIGVRNTLVTKNEAVKAAWSQVDIALQRRADLIPNLVETVKGYATQEQTVFGDIAKARSQLLGASTPAEKIAANNQLDGLVVKVLALQEAYPCKSNENFMRLQDELAGTENRLARAAKNDTLQTTNTYATVPMIVRELALANDAYFKAAEGSREVPKVNFGTPAQQSAPQPAPAK
jgi:LemA protein